MDRRGLTLVELLMAGTTMVLVAAAVWVVTESSRQMWTRTDVRLTALGDAQRAMNRLVEDLHRASRADVLCTVGDPADPADDQLSFFLPPRAAGDQVTYFVSAGRQLVRSRGGLDQPVASNLLAFTPVCQTGGLVRLALATRATTAQGGTLTQQLETQVWAQNPH